MPNTVLNFYGKILNSLGCEVDDKGLVSIKIAGTYRPLFVDKNNQEKRLCLPTKEFLDNPEWGVYCPFHPLSESIVKGESLVIKEMKTLINLRITEVATTLAMGLMDVAVDTDKHKKLRPAQLEFLKVVPNVNAKTITNMSKILCGLSITGDRRFSSIYIKRGGQMDGVTYKRLAVVSFPFIEEVNKDEKEVFDVKLTNAEKSAIKNIFNYILPNTENASTYNFGSDSNYAPNFHSLCGAYIKVMKQLNAIVDLFKKQLDDHDKLYTDISWEEELEDIGVYYNKIPTLMYNDGEAAKQQEQIGVTSSQAVTQVAPAIVPLPAIVPSVPTPMVNYGAPQIQTQPETTEDGKVSWSSIVSRNPSLQQPMFNAQTPFAPPPTPPGGFAGYDRGMPVHQQFPNYGYQQPMPQYGVRSSGI